MPATFLSHKYIFDGFELAPSYPIQEIA